MKQNNKSNSKEVVPCSSLTNMRRRLHKGEDFIMLTEFETMEIAKKSSNTSTVYVSGPQKRPLFNSKNSVKSFPKNDLKILANELLKKNTCPLKALMIFNDNDDKEKLVQIDDMKVVTRNGKSSLKMVLSNKSLDSEGYFATNAISLSDVNVKTYKIVSFIFCQEFDCAM